MSTSATPKLLIGASSGGHMVELQALLEASGDWPVQPSVMVGTLAFVSSGTTNYVIGECNRHQPLAAIRVLVRSIGIVLKEKPDVMLTTGSMPLALLGLVAKLFGSRLIWIDSISQTDGISVSGRMVKPFADLFFVQWPDLAKRFSGTVYHGELV